MALATGNTFGSILLRGDLAQTDPFNIELKNSGATPGSFIAARVDVLTNGTIAFARDIIGGDDMIASDTVYGTVQIGTNVNVSSAIISVDTAENNTIGVVKSANVNHITITNGDMNIGTEVVAGLGSHEFGHTQYETLHTIVGNVGTYTPDLAVGKLFLIELSADGQLELPVSGVIGDEIDVVVRTNGHSFVLDAGYNNTSTYSDIHGTAIITFVILDTNTFVTIVNNDYS